MTILKKKYGVWLIVIVLIGGMAVMVNSLQATPRGNLKEQTFKDLNKIRKTKKKEVVAYFKEITNLAGSIEHDQTMLRYFTLMKQRKNDPDLEYEIDKHYILAYGNFYDILFVDSSGYVFHSIKKESDYHKNLIQSEFENQQLANILKTPGDNKFTEFDYYRPSDEVAAFFPVAVKIDNHHQGWFILQCDVNKINAILTDRKGLGRTGEIYLVNKEQLMLSDSRFMEDSTILRQKVDTVAVREALEQKTGNKIIEDYRKVKVFSSYESFNVLGATWILIAEIDEDEIITEHYKRHKKYFQSQFVQYLASQSTKTTVHTMPVFTKRKRVDMNEFAKSEADSVLTTEGVATCTAVSIIYPDKFAYLAHISPTDEIYLINPLTKIILRNKYQNFTSELLGKIKFYEIYPYELKNLQFIIVATHSRSFAKAIDSFLSHGVELANIKFLYNRQARFANVVLSPTDNKTWVQWSEVGRSYAEDSSRFSDLGEILKKIIRYDA